MNQHQTILNALQDQKWHCSNELRDLFVPEYRSRINELRKRGYVITKSRCTIHQHKGISQMWRLIPQHAIHPLQVIITAKDFLATFPSKKNTRNCSPAKSKCF